MKHYFPIPIPIPIVVAPFHSARIHEQFQSLFVLLGCMGPGEEKRKARGSWGEGKGKRRENVVPRAPLMFYFPRFSSVSPLMEPLRRREISLSSSDAILTELFLYASQETGRVCRTFTESGRGRVVLLNVNFECPGTYKKLNGNFFVEVE